MNRRTKKDGVAFAIKGVLRNDLRPLCNTSCGYSVPLLHREKQSRRNTVSS